MITCSAQKVPSREEKFGGMDRRADSASAGPCVKKICTGLGGATFALRPHLNLLTGILA
jgi:hypothetical protein